jgi:ribonuclease BN (tRNA processing enzyme)
LSGPSTFEVIPLGNGNFNTSTRFATSLLLIAGGRPILIDCPDPIFRMCSEAEGKSGRKIDPGLIDDIVITHLHGDHSNGLESLGFWRRFSHERGVRPHIYTSDAVREKLWQKLEPAMGRAMIPGETEEQVHQLEDYYEVSSCGFGERFSIGEVEFETRRTLHSIPCFGFRAAYRGRCFGYSCDTAFEQAHIDFLAGSDLIFHETGEGFHTSLESLEALPEAIRRKMVLVHLDDGFPGSQKIQVAEVSRVYTV